MFLFLTDKCKTDRVTYFTVSYLFTLNTLGVNIMEIWQMAVQIVACLFSWPLLRNIIFV